MAENILEFVVIASIVTLSIMSVYALAVLISGSHRMGINFQQVCINVTVYAIRWSI